MKKKKAGFTLIEMMIVLVLTAIILSIMLTIFLTGNRVFADTDVKSDLQIEGQTTHETLSNLGIQGAGIKEVDTIDFEKDSDSARKEAIMDKWNPIKKIVLYVVEPDPNDIYNRKKDKKIAYTFVLEDSTDGSKGKKLSFIKPGSSSGKILSTNVDSFQIKPSNTGVDFEVILKKKKAFADEKRYPIKVEVLFRNKDVILDTPNPPNT